MILGRGGLGRSDLREGPTIRHTGGLCDNKMRAWEWDQEHIITECK